jgi:ATP adenylyltransferase
MKFEELVEFIEQRMRMSHVYQPVMLKTLLGNNRECSETTIARELLQHDLSQI